MKMAINQTKITPIINLKNIFSTMAINDGDIHRSNLALDEQKMEMGHTNKGTHTDKREDQRKQVQEQLKPLEAWFVQTGHFERVRNFDSRQLAV
jgi:hypothetical protein